MNKPLPELPSAAPVFSSNTVPKTDIFGSTSLDIPSPDFAAIKDTRPDNHIAFLDGLRGVAALYVVLYHCLLIVTWHGKHIPPMLHRLTFWMDYGRLGVAVFIVLSGYCLMLPIAHSADGQLRYGFGEYIRRRARRLLPPYYICVLICLACIALIPALRQPHGDWWNHTMPAFSAKSLLLHLTMTHNLSDQTAWTINGSLWSVATEWQIYFLFPTILLPVWRRWGNIALITVAFALGLAPWLTPHNLAASAGPWYLGLFALGMMGAVISHSHQARYVWLRERCPWMVCLMVLGGVLAWYAAPHATNAQTVAQETLAGLTTVCLILHCLQSAKRRPSAPSLLLRILQHPLAVRLGAFSYSLYLMHALVLGLVLAVLRPMGLSGTTQFAVLIGIGMPLAIATAYGFHLLFERPFLNTKS